LFSKFEELKNLFDKKSNFLKTFHFDKMIPDKDQRMFNIEVKVVPDEDPKTDEDPTTDDEEIIGNEGKH